VELAFVAVVAAMQPETNNAAMPYTSHSALRQALQQESCHALRLWGGPHDSEVGARHRPECLLGSRA